MRFQNIITATPLVAVYAVAAHAVTTRAVTAQSPPGFEPPIEQQLSVNYAGLAVNPAGIDVPALAVVDAPTLDLRASLKGTFLSVLMDFSVQLPGASSNQTLIHWIQPGFSGLTHPFRAQSDAVAPYFPPGPPPGQTHTYGVFLYAQPDRTFAIPPEFETFFQNLTASVNNRIGFDLDKFAASSGLGEPLAANFFFVSTPNNETSTASSSASASSSPTGQANPMPRATGDATSIGAIKAVLLGLAITGFMSAL